MSEEFPVKVRRIGNFYVEGFDLYLNSVFYGILEEKEKIKVKKMNSSETDKLFYYLVEKLKDAGYEVEAFQPFGSKMIQISEPRVCVEITTGVIEVYLKERNALAEELEEKRENFGEFLKEFEKILSVFKF